MLCEICNRKLEIFRKLKKFNLLKCNKCNHIVTNLKVNKSYYMKTYSNEYVDEKHKNWMNNPNYELFEKINSFIKTKKKGKILDLGCGTGLLLKYLNNKNPKYDLTGVDIITKNSKKKSKITFIKKEIFKYFPQKKFSFIISIAVIEHVPKVKLFLDQIKKISIKDSHCIILTINTDSFLYKIANFLYYLNIKIPFIRLYDPHHLNHFSKKSFEKFFKKNGFSVVKRIKTPISMKQIDYPYNNIFTKYFLYLGLIIILQMEKFFDKSWLQTVIFKRNI